MEIVDIVDEDLNILYQISKQEAHEKGLLHKCVIAEVTNSKGQILLIKPYSYKQDAGQYVSPVGGHVSAGESDKDALKREVMEEIGMKDFTYKLKGKGIFNRFVLNRHENHYFLLYELFTDEMPQLGDEAETYKWFTKEELKKELKENIKEFGDAYIFILNNFYPELLKA
jgi:8-oxo-dGTP pyrophosphatase MutT (NUDIX family)